MNRFIVMDRSANMPQSCWGKYRRVAVVETNLPEGREPKMISARALGVIRIVKVWDKLHAGASVRSVYQEALVEAQALADRLNTRARRKAA